MEMERYEMDWGKVWDEDRARERETREGGIVVRAERASERVLLPVLLSGTKQSEERWGGERRERGREGSATRLTR